MRVADRKNPHPGEQTNDISKGDVGDTECPKGGLGCGLAWVGGAEPWGFSGWCGVGEPLWSSLEAFTDLDQVGAGLEAQRTEVEVRAEVSLTGAKGSRQGQRERRGDRDPPFPAPGRIKNSALRIRNTHC